MRRKVIHPKDTTPDRPARALALMKGEAIRKVGSQVFGFRAIVLWVQILSADFNQMCSVVMLQTKEAFPGFMQRIDTSVASVGFPCSRPFDRPFSCIRCAKAVLVLNAAFHFAVPVAEPGGRDARATRLTRWLATRSRQRSWAADRSRCLTIGLEICE
jgi:hypothetical protein